jgi:hypothetical protein
MVREQSPGVDGERPALRQGGEAPDEVGAIRVIPEDRGAFDPPHHHVMERLRRIETRLARHGKGEASRI